jgi:hypothetical protein
MDVVIGSVHAVTDDGLVVIASYSGSQFAAYAFGASKVIWVVGAQKIVTDLDQAFARIEQHSLPLESQRLQEVYGQPSSIGGLSEVDCGGGGGAGLLWRVGHWRVSCLAVVVAGRRAAGAWS